MSYRHAIKEHELRAYVGKVLGGDSESQEARWSGGSRVGQVSSWTKREKMSRPGVTLLPPLWGHLAISRDIFGCQIVGRALQLASRSQGSAKYLTTPRTAPTTENYPALTSLTLEVRNPFWVNSTGLADKGTGLRGNC